MCLSVRILVPFITNQYFNGCPACNRVLLTAEYAETAKICITLNFKQFLCASVFSSEAGEIKEASRRDNRVLLGASPKTKNNSLAEYAELTEKATTGVLEIKQISAPLCSRAKRAR